MASVRIYFISFFQALAAFKPQAQIKNPVMFVTYLGAIFATLYSIEEIVNRSFSWLHIQIAFWLLFTVFISNFAQALAESRGKAQTDFLRKMQQQLDAKLILNGKTTRISASELKKGAIVECQAGDIIPADGEVVEGIAMVDESAITGESAPVLRESGGDRSAVTAGTRVVSDQIKIQITAEIGNTFLDRIIHLVEVAKRQKTPNEISLSIVLSSMTLVFLVVLISLKVFFDYSAAEAGTQKAEITLPILISLLVCLIPTTISGLMNAIGISGMDRLIRKNVVAKSGRSVESAGDIDVLLLDKTGTITLGSRMAVEFIPTQGIEEKELAYFSQISSLADETPEGRSIVVLAKNRFDLHAETVDTTQFKFVPFSAGARMSGVDILAETGELKKNIRKGSVDAITKHIQRLGGLFPSSLQNAIEKIAKEGGTPLLVSVDKRIVGAIYLKDIIKGGIKERFMQLRKMGIRTIMITGDNPLTAAAIAAEAGVDDFLAEATPELKLEKIKEEQSKGHLVAMAGDGTNDAPALAQADVGVAMNTGTQPSREAGNMVDLDSNPTKVIEIVEIGKQLLMTRGALTTFSIANDIVKYFAIIPAIFGTLYSLTEGWGPLNVFNILHLKTPESAILSTVIFNALAIFCLVPLALIGVNYQAKPAYQILMRNLCIYGIGGTIAPFIGIKIIDWCVMYFGWV